MWEKSGGGSFTRADRSKKSDGTVLSVDSGGVTFGRRIPSPHGYGPEHKADMTNHKIQLNLFAHKTGNGCAPTSMAINKSNVPLRLRIGRKSELKHPKKQEKAPRSGPPRRAEAPRSGPAASARGVRGGLPRARGII
ncbi:hypothetical protein B0H19DRAFT_1063265 [Mycena capillaripes]|nr:hypothetical protein B0H19DRAFT_1063265 [Mycena capillaripes]